MRDERRDRHPLELAGHRRREGEDVVHDGVRRELGHGGPRLAGGANDRLVWLERSLPGGEHGVFGGGDESHSGGLHVVAPARPGLEYDVVTPSDQPRPEREHRESVAWVSERAEEQTKRPRAALRAIRRLARAQPSASSATARSCATRSSVVNAIGAIISVPTPASRYAASRSRTVPGGPDRVTVSISSTGTAASASAFSPARYRS